MRDKILLRFIRLPLMLIDYFFQDFSDFYVEFEKGL